MTTTDARSARERLRKASEISAAVELWFFRDLGETQRRQLFNWCGFPGVEATGEALQRDLLKGVLALLATPTPTSAERREEIANIIARAKWGSLYPALGSANDVPGGVDEQDYRAADAILASPTPTSAERREEIARVVIAEVERQCAIGAGEASVCGDTGLLQMSIDLDLYGGFVDAILALPSAEEN